MDKRTKILASAFGAIILYAFVAQVAYPNWIRPILTYDERIADRQEVLDNLLDTKARVDEAKFQYRRYVERIGSFDIAKVENEFREQLITLIELHNLKNRNLTPSRKTEDRKTNISMMTVTVQADGPLQGVAGLMKDIAELPYLLRFGNVAISPGKSTLRGGRPTLHEQVQIRLPIVLWVLPPKRTVGVIDESTLVKADPVIRHRERDYSSLWTGRPFSEYLRPVALLANAGEDHNLPKPGRTVVLRGSVRGGIGEYTIQWSPTEGLSDPTDLNTKVDTSKPGEFHYTLTVADEAGATSSDDVTVTIAEAPTPVARANPRPQRTPKDLGPKRWPDGRYMQLVMVLGSTYNGERKNEVMVYDRKTRESQYYAVGDEFDGGELVSVHPTGGLVRRANEYYVYPVGTQLDQDLKLEDAEMFYELETAAEAHRAKLAAEKKQAEAAEKEQAKDDSEDKAKDAPTAASPNTGDTTASEPVATKPEQPIATKPEQPVATKPEQPGDGGAAAAGSDEPAANEPAASKPTTAPVTTPPAAKHTPPVSRPGAVGARPKPGRVPGQRARTGARKPK